MKSALVAVVLCSALLWAQSRHKLPEILAVTNVNVVDTRYGGIRPNVTVVVKDGIISSIAKMAFIDAGTHVHVVNGAGKFLIPGLWDMNSHLSGPSAAAWDRKTLHALYLANGVTGLRDSQLDRNTIPPRETKRPEIMRPETMHPEIIGGEILGREIQGHEIRGREITNREDASAVQSMHKIPSSSDDVTELLLAQGNMPNPETGRLPVTVRGGKSFAELPVEFETREGAARSMALVNDLHRAGVQFLAGSNAPAANLLPGVSLHQVLERLVDGGFTPLQALQTATLNPALYMAKLDKYGVVDSGRVADLVLLDANPLNDIRNTQKIFGVVLRGAYFSREQLEKMLRQ